MSGSKCAGCVLSPVLQFRHVRIRARKRIRPRRVRADNNTSFRTRRAGGRAHAESAPQEMAPVRNACQIGAPRAYALLRSRDWAGE